MLHHANAQPADQIDQQNQHTGQGITAHELAGTIHGAVEVGLFADLLTAGDGFFTCQQAGVEIGINGHLLAGHGIQGEPGADFGDPFRALGHHHEINDRENDEHHDPDGVVATDDEIAKGLDHVAGGARPLVPVQQYDAGTGHVKRQPQQRDHEQNRRKNAEIQRPHHVDDRQQNANRQGDVEGEQPVQRDGRQWHHHHRQHHHHHQRHRQAVFDGMDQWRHGGR